MGMIFRARDELSGELVALKLLQAHVEPGEAERFAREAQLLAELQHPRIVGHVAHGVCENGQPYLAMEWLAGEDLEQHLRRRVLGIDECVALLTGVAAALAEAHQRGIIHRDLKPGNLFLRGCDPHDVVVLDFGLARRTLRAASLTRTGVVVGTPEYMAPEQARGEQDIGTAADIFSLGCVLFECVAGSAPFVGEHLTAILVKLLIEDPPLLHTLRPAVPLQLSKLVARMLEKNPRDRFVSGVELLDAVRRLHLTSQRSPPASGSQAGPVTLTPHEQQFFSVAVAVFGAPGQLVGSVPAELLAALVALGVEIERLADGALVATVPTTVSASDQALQAARCGLAMKTHLPAAEVAVATGRGSWGGQMPIGEAVDRAMALLVREVPAPPHPSSGVWLGELTDKLLAGRLEVVQQDGRAQLVVTQRFTASEGQRRLLGQRTPFVGREQELRVLESVLAACIADSVARAVGVIAPPGLGKSRLRHEFLLTTTQRYPELVILSGAGDLPHAGASYHSLGQALRGLCGLADGERGVAEQARLRERLGRHLVGTPESIRRTLDFLGELCGLPCPAEGNRVLQTARHNPKVMHDQITQAFIEWLRRECAAAPVLLVLEDLHWGDALTALLLVEALQQLAELPLLVLALARPEVQELFPGFWNPRYILEQPLRGLSKRAAERLAQDVLLRVLGTVDAGTVARIVDQGSGHPLFLEELLRSTAEGRGDTLPETVLAMLQSRLSQLDPHARQILRAASVFGEASFTRAGVAALASGSATDLDLSLAALVRAEWIEPVRDGPDADIERYRFRHALVRDAAYALLTDQNRVAAHRLAGAYLEALGGVEPAVLAEHAHRGQEDVRAARLFVEAAMQAMARYDPELTQRHAQRAIACDEATPQRGVLRTLLAWTCLARMDLGPGYEHALAAATLLPSGSYWWAKAIGICFYSFFMINRFEHIERLIHDFMTASPEANAGVAFLEAGTALCVFFTNVGDRRAAAATVEKMRAVAADLDPQEQGYLLIADSYRSCKLEPDIYHATRAAHQALELATHSGETFLQVSALFYLGTAYTSLGCVDEGEQSLRQGTALALRVREDFGLVVTHLHLGLNLAEQTGEAAQAEARTIAAAYIDRPQIGPAMHGLCHHIIGQTRLNAGDLGGAESALRRALEVFAPLLPSRLLVAPLLVEVLLRRGRVAEARALAEDGLRAIESWGGLGHCEVPIRLAVVLTRRADGDQAGADSALADAVAEVRLRAAKIPDPALQRRFLASRDNQRLLALAAE